MTNNYNFKCKKCGHKLTPNGKAYGTYWIFFFCLTKDGGCGEGVWIDVANKVGNQGYEYKEE